MTLSLEYRDEDNKWTLYEASTLCLHETIESKAKIIKVFEDSTLKILHVKGEWKSHYNNLIP
ncbi:hypothetical protein Lal_00035443 [Lupinus albus]|nr:hypothetical protein Lal_00035443 [Lupinus albus]